MSWKVQEHDGWVETFPLDDEQQHIRTIEIVYRPFDKTIVCRCPCNPRISKEGEVFVVNHNSFDGREGIEWVNELLK